MTRQSLIYETAVPLSTRLHAKLSLEASGGYGFSADVSAVPLMAVEFGHAASEYAIVFSSAGDDIVAAAVLGSKSDAHNLYLSAEAQWRARYIPAFIRRYPFVFAASADGKTLTLCIDDTHPGVNSEGRGQRLFDDDGRPSDFTQSVLKFLQEYQAQFERSKRFGKQLKALGLLQGMQASVTTPQGERLDLGSFLAVSREKLRALDRDALAALARTDELELIYLHLHSLRNFDQVKDRLVEARAQPAVAPAQAAAS